MCLSLPLTSLHCVYLFPGCLFTFYFVERHPSKSRSSRVIYPLSAFADIFRLILHLSIHNLPSRDRVEKSVEAHREMSFYTPPQPKTPPDPDVAGPGVRHNGAGLLSVFGVKLTSSPQVIVGFLLTGLLATVASGVSALLSSLGDGDKRTDLDSPQWRIAAYDY